MSRICGLGKFSRNSLTAWGSRAKLNCSAAAFSTRARTNSGVNSAKGICSVPTKRRSSPSYTPMFKAFDGNDLQLGVVLLSQHGEQFGEFIPNHRRRNNNRLVNAAASL